MKYALYCIFINDIHIVQDLKEEKASIINTYDQRAILMIFINKWVHHWNKIPNLY